MKQNSFYLTTTLPYVNAELHMGHALEFIRADAIARYKKLKGFDVFFNTGTDEHGMKIYEKALSEGLEVQAFVDQNFLKFKESLKAFGMSENLHFIRTTDESHVKLAQEFWNRVYENGYIYKKNYEAKYCVGCESEKTDSELNEAGFCPDHDGRELQTISEENYFFKYSSFTEKLLKFYEENPNFIIPEFRFNEMKAFVSRGLQDFSISRLKTKMPWGIPVPNDSEHVMYVWFDALTNYINTLDWQDNKEQFEKYWVSGTPTQYCGKDNTRFQGAMWQAMLMAADFPNSSQIIVNGFITGDGGVKMSKTLGNVVNPREIAEEYGTDALRYFMLREISSFEDSPFTRERFLESYNSGLANGLGNLTSRILTLSEKYLDKCPEIPTESIPEEFFVHLQVFDIKSACDFIWSEISLLDGYIQANEPFKVIKIDLEKGKAHISYMIQNLYKIALMLNPIMPETSKKIIELIKNNKKPEPPLFLRK
jgi:methionyl-tRNA synthetase